MNKILDMQTKIFKRIDIVNKKVKEVNDKISERINLFEDPEESTDEIVKENLKTKEIYLNELRFLNELLREIEVNIYEKEKPIALLTDYFVENFNSTQDALDYINKKLKGIELMEGTRELFTGLAYDKSITSYSPTRLFYVEYKFNSIFGFDIELKYEVKRYDDYEVPCHEQDQDQDKKAADNPGDNPPIQQQ